MKFNEKVWKLCSLIPKGKVTTYKEIAIAMDTKGYQAIGNAVRANPNAPKVPCHRVVKKDGGTGGYTGILDSEEKRKILKKEGIKIKNGIVEDFEKLTYKFTIKDKKLIK